VSASSSPSSRAAGSFAAMRSEVVLSRSTISLSARVALAHEILVSLVRHRAQRRVLLL
jgi:hypothetical protein